MEPNIAPERNQTSSKKRKESVGFLEKEEELGLQGEAGVGTKVDSSPTKSFQIEEHGSNQKRKDRHEKVT